MLKLINERFDDLETKQFQDELYYLEDRLYHTEKK
jgi:hypothetical protein